MIDTSTLITIIPPIVTGIFAYLIALKKNKITGDLNKAKLDAEIQNQALTIVQGVMHDMRDELKREIVILRDDNEKLKKQSSENYFDIKTLREQLRASDVLVETLKNEIESLRNTIKMYENEISRLKQQKQG